MISRELETIKQRGDDMRFCIANVEYFETVGFDTTDWRKSVDGTKAIVHYNYVKVLIPESDVNLTLYSYPSVELDTILNSPEWTSEEVI